MLIAKKAFASITLLFAFCFFTSTFAHAASGYTSPDVSPTVITLGHAVTLYNEPNCSPGIGHPSVTFYASTTPDTVGSSIGELNYGDNSAPWTPTAAGTYYIAEYVSSNGANCTGESSPSFVTVTVNP